MRLTVALLTAMYESASLRWWILPQRPGSAGRVAIHQCVSLLPQDGSVFD